MLAKLEAQLNKRGGATGDRRRKKRKLGRDETLFRLKALVEVCFEIECFDRLSNVTCFCFGLVNTNNAL